MRKSTILLYTLYIIFMLGITYMQIVSWVAMWGWTSLIAATIGGVAFGMLIGKVHYRDWKADLDEPFKRKPTC
jgi:hypothetical protein